MSALRSLLLASALFATPVVAPLAAQEHAPAAAATEKVDIITPHITDSYHMELPSIFPPF